MPDLPENAPLPPESPLTGAVSAAGQDMLSDLQARTEEMPCAQCGSMTHHLYDGVLEEYSWATELLMRCIGCNISRTWMHLHDTPLPLGNPSEWLSDF